jgi:hypothetical protein
MDLCITADELSSRTPSSMTAGKVILPVATYLCIIGKCLTIRERSHYRGALL